MVVALNGDCIHGAINASLPQERVLLLWNKYHLFMLSPPRRNGHKTRAKGCAKLFMHSIIFATIKPRKGVASLSAHTHRAKQRFSILRERIIKLPLACEIHAQAAQITSLSTAFSGLWAVQMGRRRSHCARARPSRELVVVCLLCEVSSAAAAAACIPLYNGACACGTISCCDWRARLLPHRPQKPVVWTLSKQRWRSNFQTEISRHSKAGLWKFALRFHFGTWVSVLRYPGCQEVGPRD